MIIGKRTSLRARNGRGFTLVETVVCVVIVAGMLVASLEMLGTAARLKRSQSTQCRSIALAKELLSEILQQPYQDPTTPTLVLGPDLLETRASYDDVDDYNGLSESSSLNIAGIVILGYSGWSRSVTVEYADPANIAGPASLTDQNLKRISVIVTAPDGRTTRLVALRSKNGAYDKTYTSASTYPASATITVQVGTDSSTKVVTGVNMVNQVP